MLAKELPRAELTEIDPAQDTLPISDNVIERFDCVLLDYDWGPVGSGLDWLRQHGRLEDSPAIILLTAADDVYVAARAMKLGAEDYLNKRDLTARRLAELITSATANRAVSVADAIYSDPPAKSLKPILNAASGPPTIEGYEIGTMIGKGATSQIYLAERIVDGLTVVLKLLKTHLLEASEDRIDRFIREAELVSQVDSPQIVRIYEQKFTDDVAFIAMEYLPGGDLRDRMFSGISPREALQYLHELLLGLQAIHRVGVVHRDLKPGNIMFRKDGSLAIADFGLSRRTDSSVDLTSSGQIIGTPAYMSPEQGQGEVATPSSDLYCAGVVLYEMLCGQKPFEAASLTGVIYKHISAPVPRMAEEFSIFQDFIDRLMAKSPAGRPADAGEALEICESLLASLDA